jgi:hypothetical protein
MVGNGDGVSWWVIVRRTEHAAGLLYQLPSSHLHESTHVRSYISRTFVIGPSLLSAKYDTQQPRNLSK